MKKVFVPGSKSASNRALVLAAISDEPTILRNVLEADDIRFLRSALMNFGVKFENLGNNDWKVIPPKTLEGSNSDNFIGNGGTPARFLVALSLIMQGNYTLRGVDRMHERPFSDLFEAIAEMRVGIEYLGEEGFLPAGFNNERQTTSNEQSKLSLSGRVSSQFLSGLLLVAPKLENGLEIEIVDEIPSRPYVEMTVEMLKIWGVKVDVSDDFKHFKVSPGIKSPGEFQVPGDCSSASYPIAFSILSHTPISIENYGARTMQGDEKFLEIAEKTGAKVNRAEERVEIIPPEEIKPLGNVDFGTMPDVSMTGMILAAFSEGSSHFVGLESLRVKECDRIAAMESGLISLGIGIEVTGDDVVIKPNSKFKIQNSKIRIDSHEDHRIAMVFGVIRAAFDLDFKISDPNCVAKSWPDFWVELADWSGGLRKVAGVILSRYPKSLSPDGVGTAPFNKGSENGKEYLIVKKPRKEHAWQFPQGGVDEGETQIQAAEREVREECGADLQFKFINKEPVGEYKYLFPADFKRHEPGIVGARVSFFQAKYEGGEVEVDEKEIVEYKWTTKDELQEYFEEEYWEAVKEMM